MLKKVNKSHMWSSVWAKTVHPPKTYISHAGNKYNDLKHKFNIYLYISHIYFIKKSIYKLRIR